jgi:hypothetical protein
MLTSCLRCAGDNDWVVGLGRQRNILAVSYQYLVRRELVRWAAEPCNYPGTSHQCALDIR